MNILYFTSSAFYQANLVRDHDSAFFQYSNHTFHLYDILTNSMQPELSHFDALVFSYSFWAYTGPLSKNFIKIIKNFKKPKVAILQDEYTYFLRHRQNILDMEVNAIVTLVPPVYWPVVFGTNFKAIPKMPALVGYIPDNIVRLFASQKQLQKRNWNIGYRGRALKPIFGKLGREKYEIGLKMKKICRQRNISANIEVDEDKRIYGEKWPQFIRNCRVMLGTESGANVFDFDGSIQKTIDAYTSTHPEAGFDEIHAHCIGDADGLIKMNQISPKMFETIALGTGLLLFEGEYSGILKPWRHYIPLKKDYSNLDEALEAVDDLELLEKMIQTSYDDIVASGKYSYKSFIKRFDDFIESLPCERHGEQEIPDSPEIWKDVPPPPAKRDFSLLQEREMARVQELAASIKDEKLLFYGAGAAFDLYAPLFAAHNDVVGVFLDGDFHKKASPSIMGYKVYGEEDLEKLRVADRVVVFCRLNYRLDMTRRALEFFPENPEPDICTLFAWENWFNA